jgi:hypothetical protein
MHRTCPREGWWGERENSLNVNGHSARPVCAPSRNDKPFDKHVPTFLPRVLVSHSPIEINVAMGQPSDLIIEMNMLDLARYALICQSEGLVPIVEPDVSLKGDHTLEQAVAINTKIQVRVNVLLVKHAAQRALLESSCKNKPH